MQLAQVLHLQFLSLLPKDGGIFLGVEGSPYYIFNFSGKLMSGGYMAEKFEQVTNRELTINDGRLVFMVQ